MAGIPIPSSLCVSDVTVTDNNRIYANESISGIIDRQDSGIHINSGTLTLTGSGIAGAKSLRLFIMSLRGRLNEFDLSLGFSYASDIPSNPTLSNNADINATKINFSTVTTLDAGSVFNVENDNKMYTIMEDVIGGGIVRNVSISPSLRLAANATTELNFIAPSFTATLTTDNSTATHDESGFISSITLDWREST